MTVSRQTRWQAALVVVGLTFSVPASSVLVGERLHDGPADVIQQVNTPAPSQDDIVATTAISSSTAAAAAATTAAAIVPPTDAASTTAAEASTSAPSVADGAIAAATISAHAVADAMTAPTQTTAAATTAAASTTPVASPTATTGAAAATTAAASTAPSATADASKSGLSTGTVAAGVTSSAAAAITNVNIVPSDVRSKTQKAASMAVPSDVQPKTQPAGAMAVTPAATATAAQKPSSAGAKQGDTAQAPRPSGAKEDTSIAGHPICFAGNEYLCFDMPEGAAENGNELQVYDFAGEFPQKWIVSGDRIKFSAKGEKGEKCLDIVEGNMANGASLQLWDCLYENKDSIFQERHKGQEWEYDDQKQRIILRSTKAGLPSTQKCLDLPGGTSANAMKLQIWTCDGSAGQKWVMNTGVGAADPDRTTTTTTLPWAYLNHAMASDGKEGEKKADVASAAAKGVVSAAGGAAKKSDVASAAGEAAQAAPKGDEGPFHGFSSFMPHLPKFQLPDLSSFGVPVR